MVIEIFSWKRVFTTCGPAIRAVLRPVRGLEAPLRDQVRASLAHLGVAARGAMENVSLGRAWQPPPPRKVSSGTAQLTCTALTKA